MTLPVRLFWCVVFFGPASYMIHKGDFLVAAILISAGVGALSGFRMGALSILTSLGAITAAIIYAPSLGMQYEPDVAKALGTTGLTNRCLSVAGCGMGIAALVGLVTYFTIGRMVRNRSNLARLNRFGGFTFGLAQGAFAVVLLVGGMLAFEPIQRQQLATAGVAEEDFSVIHKAVFWTAEQVDKSVAGEYLRQYNPIVKIPQLNQLQKVQRTAAVLSDPAKMDEVMRHPSILELQRQPEVQEAVHQLRSDPSLNEILTSGKPMDSTAAMTLLNHPAVLNLIDQPGFLEQATQAINDAGL